MSVAGLVTRRLRESRAIADVFADFVEAPSGAINIAVCLLAIALGLDV